jgi:hypothetical protein
MVIFLMDPWMDPAQLANTNVNPFAAFALGARMDAVFQGTGQWLPPNIILDYAYGVATYKCWRSDEVHDLMRRFHDNHYSNIPVPPPSPPSNDSDPLSDNPNVSESSSEDHPGPDHPLPASLQGRCYKSTRGGDVMVKVMDDLNLVLMTLQGVTPQELVCRREEQMEEEELRAQIASRSKVLEWIGATV